jgi:hypothetical protein
MEIEKAGLECCSAGESMGGGYPTEPESLEEEEEEEKEEEQGK